MCCSDMESPERLGRGYLTTRKNGDKDATDNRNQQHPRRYQ